MMVVGIDPDTNKHGVAWVRDGVLIDLASLNTEDLVNRLVAEAANEQLAIKVEDINAFRPVIQRPGMNRNQMMRIAQNIGAVKHSAVLLVSAINDAGLHVNMVFPLPKLKSGKQFKADQFNKFTGWSGLSNADTRDAAMIALNGKPVRRQQLLYCGG